MFDIIFERVREDRYIVDKSSTILSMLLQRPIYKTLYIQRGVRIFYKDYIQMFYLSLADESETILVIWVNEQLKEEVRYIDHCDKPLSADRVDNLLL